MGKNETIIVEINVVVDGKCTENEGTLGKAIRVLSSVMSLHAPDHGVYPYKFTFRDSQATKSMIEQLEELRKKAAD